MAKGISLHVGMNRVDPSIGALPLTGCVNDAHSMRDLAAAFGFETEVITNEKAKLMSVMTKIRAASAELDTEDIFFFSFSGHGSYLGDEDNDEPDHRDETLVLYDYMLSDDVLRLQLWPCFKPGVRILMVADSCQSGTVLHVLDADPNTLGDWTKLSAEVEISRACTTAVTGVSPRAISNAARLQHIAANRGFYDELKNSAPTCGTTLNARVLLLPACRDDEETADGDPHGAFTQALLDVWNNGQFVGDYNDLMANIANRLTCQHPELAGDGQPDFSNERPFTI